MLIDYKVTRTENCALIDTNEWISSSEITVQNVKGRKSTTLITEVLEENFKEKSEIEKGDYILMTKVAADVALMRSYSLNNKKCFNLPVSQIIGKFNNRNINLANLKLAKGKVLIEKIEKNTSKLWVPDTSDMLGKIVKVNSENNFLLKGVIVMLKDNIATPIKLDNKEFFAADDTNIVGIVDNNNVNYINESILMTPYIHKYVPGSDLLITPDIDFENLDYSDIYNRDLFKVEYCDENLKKIKKGDIILVRRDYTSYVYMNDEKFFLLNGMQWIEAKLV